MNDVSTNLRIAYNLNNWQKNYILECGAGLLGEETAGLRDSNNCYYMEAHPELYSCLKNKVNVFNYALADYDGETEFTLTSHFGNSSIKHSEEHLKELSTYNSISSKIKVKCITYETFIKEILKHNIDVLVLDVEGYEKHILKTFIDLTENCKPKLIVIECGYDWKERYELLKKLNYNLDFFYFNNAYLSLNSNTNTIKNIEQIKNFRKDWSKWIWQGKEIYNEYYLKDTPI